MFTQIAFRHTWHGKKLSCHLFVLDTAAVNGQMCKTAQIFQKCENCNNKNPLKQSCLPREEFVFQYVSSHP